MVKIIKEHMWSPLMDSDKNPLMALPYITRYQVMMVLAMMWSFIFCAMIGWMMLFPYWVVGHIVLLSLGAFMTNYTFKTATMASHRDMYKTADGKGVVHDDIWGG
jgi:hypothetical protein